MGELLLLRHAEAMHMAPGQEDFERHLSEAGKVVARHIGQTLAAAGLEPDLVVSSPAVRTMETCRLAGAAWALREDAIVQDLRLYGEETADVMTVLGEQAAGARRILLVGHNPGLEGVIRLLSRQPIRVAPGSAAQLEVKRPWGQLVPGCADLVAVHTAGQAAKAVR
jgi:phosphohistidine phosphatase